MYNLAGRAIAEVRFGPEFPEHFRAKIVCVGKTALKPAKRLLHAVYQPMYRFGFNPDHKLSRMSRQGTVAPTLPFRTGSLVLSLPIGSDRFCKAQKFSGGRFGILSLGFVPRLRVSEKACSGREMLCEISDGRLGIHVLQRRRVRKLNCKLKFLKRFAELLADVNLG